MPSFHTLETCRDGGTRILVTGFGVFPGAPFNPSAEIVRRLHRHRARLARLDVTLDTLLLPVVYDVIPPILAARAATFKPHVILHLGLAGRRKAVSVETRALNRAGPLHPDAAGCRPAQIIAPGHPVSHPAAYPVQRILTAIRAQNVPALRSIDAGDYVCNATLYQTLDQRLAPIAGFIHVPRPRRASLPRNRRAVPRPALDDLVRAVLAAVLILARARVARPVEKIALGRLADRVTETP